MKVKVYAKLNLTLAVGAKSGVFHDIDSVATSVDVFDEVEVVERSDGEIRLVGGPVAVEFDSAYRAAVLFQREFSTRGVNIVVKKGIPIAAGMGGSSADAAAVVYCMRQIFGIDDPRSMHALCARLGSDVNFMLRGGLARMRGKGDDLEFATLGKPLYFALTAFDAQLCTAQVYDAFDALPKAQTEQRDNSALFDALCRGVDPRPLQLFNDLQPAAQAIDGYASGYLEFCKRNGLDCHMTGSGSAYFILLPLKDAQNAVALLNENGYRSRLCATVPHGIEM